FPGRPARAPRRSRRQLPEVRNNRRRSSEAGYPTSVRIPGSAIRSETCSYSRFVFLQLQRIAENEPEKAPLKYKGLFFQEKEKEVIGMPMKLACRIPCSPFPGESWHQAPGI